MLDWIKEYQVLSGVSVAVLAAVGFLVKRWFLPGNEQQPRPQLGPSITINNSNVQAAAVPAATSRLRKQREDVRILFVDDDTKFKVVKIMKSAGWPKVSIRRDVKDLDDLDIRETDVFFIDIQGVGHSLGFADEGLGLALAIKDRYPEKKVIIYSAQTAGDRFHKALKRADGSLAKNADPYEFISLLNELTAV